VAWNRILLLVDGVGPRTAEKVIEDIIARRASPEGDATDTKLPAFWSHFNSYPEKVRDLFTALKDVAPAHLAPADKIQQLLQYYEPIFTRRYDAQQTPQRPRMFQQVADGTAPWPFLSDLVSNPPAKCEYPHPRCGRRGTVLSTIHSAKGWWNSVL
jgi:DNA helicase-2/ATP-dependent DNA helicase PcrA